MSVGRRERFETLYRSHGATVRAFVRRRMGASETDDVVSEVFLIAWRRLDDVPADPLPWLLGVARRVVANARRSQARSISLHERLGQEGSAREEAADVPVERDPRVLRALASLGEGDQEVLLLVAWDELRREQAAKVLGVSAGAFAVRLYRARRRFARALAAEDGLESRVDERPLVSEAL